MRRGALTVAAAALLIGTVAPAAPALLPDATFEDTGGRTLALAALRGRVVVIVYGTRGAMDLHSAWGRRVDGDLRARGVYRADDAVNQRPVQILALAQMGGIPGSFRGLVRAWVSSHVPKDFPLWLDWEDSMSALFGDRGDLSTVVIADRDGAVRLVVSGPPLGAAWKQVSDLLRALT
ncbi:MAG TPA: hypothetical protein VMT97_18105 [Terriglobales bacterium]|nr:hypothetical protein [Terriglobales bacterium]